MCSFSRQGCSTLTGGSGIVRLRPNGKDWTIKEQIIEDIVTGITLQFEVAPDGAPSLRLYGDFEFGNRDMSFSLEGENTGAGTLVSGLCKPAWTTEVDNPESEE